MQWTGSVSGCVAGTTNLAHQQATIDRVNYYRALVDLPPVSLLTGMPTVQSQAAALMMSKKETAESLAVQERLADVEGNIPGNVCLYPTMIRGCQARRATGIDELAIIEKMQELCWDLGTRANWNDVRRCLEITPGARTGKKPARAAR